MIFLVAFLFTFSVVNSDHEDDSKMCIDEKIKNCITTFESYLEDQFNACREWTTLAEGCSYVGTVSCFGTEANDDAIGEEAHVFYEILESYFMDACESHYKDKSLLDLSRSMFPNWYQLPRKTCLGRNKAYVVGCVDEVSNITVSDENMKICLMWNSLAVCTIERIGEKCGEEFKAMYLDHFPDKPEHVKRACASVPSDIAVDHQLVLLTSKSFSPAPLPCVTEWSRWSPCSETCGNGFKVRMRRYLNPDAFHLCRETKMVQTDRCRVDDPKCFDNIMEDENEKDCSILFRRTRTRTLSECRLIAESVAKSCTGVAVFMEKTKNETDDDESIELYNSWKRYFENECELQDRSRRVSNVVRTASEECFKEKAKICKNDAFKDNFYGLFSYDNKCSSIQVLLECSRRDAEDCFKNDHDNEVNRMLDEFENQFTTLCQADGNYNLNITVLFMDMLTTNYQKREKCVDENIFRCTDRGRYSRDVGSCGIWHSFHFCMTSNIREKCGEEVSRSFEESLPDMPENIKKQCETQPCILCRPRRPGHRKTFGK